MGGGAPDVVAATGWVRTLAGIDVYLAVRARSHELTRASMDEAVADGRLRVSPAARGCIYLISEAHLGLALAHARALARPRTERDLAKAGVSTREVEELAAGVLDVLRAGPMTTASVRKALPAGAARSLGARGKRVGLSSPLPVALRELEFAGRIERALPDGRLDTERYHWRIVSGKRRTAIADAGDHQARVRALVELFLRVSGPATHKQLATWIGVSKRAVTSALAELPVVSVAIDWPDGFADDDSARRAPHVLLETDLEELQHAATPAPRFAFLPFEDALITAHGGPAPFVDPRYHDRPVDSWGGSRPTTIARSRHVGQRPLMCGDEMIGFWEYDRDAETIVCGAFRPLSSSEKRSLREASESLFAFIRDQLGHARSFSLDTDDAVRGRVQILRAMS